MNPRNDFNIQKVANSDGRVPRLMGDKWKGFREDDKKFSTGDNPRFVTQRDVLQQETRPEIAASTNGGRAVYQLSDNLYRRKSPQSSLQERTGMKEGDDSTQSLRRQSFVHPDRSSEKDDWKIAYSNCIGSIIHTKLNKNYANMV